MQEYATVCAELDYLLGEIGDARHGELSNRERKLMRKLSKVKHSLVVCMVEAAVPPDNNATERLIRPLKIKMKVPGIQR